MPPDMAISMRHTKLKAEEAALLAGEINKPSWESRNEGIHERVSFEDSIWGFDLAGGVYYNTPLRVTYVKPDSRAEKAGIRAGDKLLKINDMDTSTLTIQQAHDIIIESGIHLKLSVTSPEDEEDSYYCYQDPLVDGYDSEEERRIEEEKAKKRRVCARVSHFWSLQWPWVSKRRLIYRESNCFMVPSKYEDARRDKYPPLPTQRYTDDIILYNVDGKEEEKKSIPSLNEVKQNTRKARQEPIANGYAENYAPNSNKTEHEEPVKTESSQKSKRSTLKVERQETMEGNNEEEEEESPRMEVVEEESPRMEEEDVNGEINESNNVDDAAVKEVDENNSEASNDILSPILENTEESTQKAEELNAEVDNEADNVEETKQDIEEGSTNVEENNNNIDEETVEVNDDDVINEVLAKPSDGAHRTDEDNILDSILSDDGQNLENSESNNER